MHRVKWSWLQSYCRFTSAKISGAIYLVLFIIIFIAIRNNFHWQILDDGNVIEDRFFPPWSYWTNFYRTRVGIEFSGLGLFWASISFLTQKNLVFIYGIMILFFLLTIKLASDIFKLLAPNHRVIQVFTIFCLMFIPGGSEEYLSLVKQEKWSLIAIELIILGFLFRQYCERKSTLYYLLGLILGTLVGKETFVFYLFATLIISLLVDRFHINSFFIKLQSLGFVGFIVYRLFPTLFYQQDNIYTSQLLNPGFQTMKSSLFSYLVFEPYFIFPLGLIVATSLLSLRRRIRVEPVVWIILIGTFLEILLLFNWAQINAYYAVQVEFLTTLFAGILYTRIKPKQAFIKFLLGCITSIWLLNGVNTSIVRSEIAIWQHSADAKAINFLLKENSGGMNQVMFNQDTEMIGNINAYAKIAELPQISPLLSVENKSCLKRLIAIPIGQPTNDRFKLRGLTWPEEKLQYSKLTDLSLKYKTVFSNVESRSYQMSIFYFPDWNYAKSPKPVTYGWKIVETICKRNG